MTVRQDELQEEPQGLPVGDGCAGCLIAKNAAQNLAEKELAFKGIRVPCCHVKVANGG